MRYLILIVISCLLACSSCTRGELVFSETYWGVDIDYHNAVTGAPLVGKDKYFTPYHLSIAEQNDTGYEEVFYYNEANVPDSARGHHIIGIGQTVLKEVDEKSGSAAMKKAISESTMFDVRYIVTLSHAQETIIDTFRLIKDNADDYRLELNGEYISSYPSPTPPRNTPLITVKRTVK